jgi:hypothetical protein
MRLRLPDDEDVAIRVWNALARGLMTVENVDIDNFPSASPDIFIPDFRTVKNFRLGYAQDAERRPITGFGLSPSTLEHLEIKVENLRSDLAELSHFRQLRTLHLSCHISSGIYGNSRKGLDFSISLPHLEALTLSYNYGVLAQLRFDVPSLDSLTVMWGLYTPLPSIHPRHIRMMSFTTDRIRLKKVIRDYILLSNALECITIDQWYRKEVKEEVTQTKLEGKASLLTQIIIEYTNGEVERIRV